MIKPVVVMIILVSLIMGCKPVEVGKDYKLKDDQLSNLLYDIQLSEVALAELPTAKRDSLKDLFWLRMTEIYKLSEVEIQAEIKTLESDPEKMKLVFDRVKHLSDSIR